MTLVSRSYEPVDLEVRATGEHRTVFGLVAPFDSPTPIVEYGRSFTEVIRRGAFTRTIRERGPAKVKLLAQHDARAMPLGRATDLVEDSRGLVGSFRISRTTAGDEALELLRDGALDAFSIGFTVPTGGERWANDGSRELLELRLHEVSLVNFPAYEGALVAGVRAAAYDPEVDPELLRRRLALALLTTR